MSKEPETYNAGDRQGKVSKSANITGDFQFRMRRYPGKLLPYHASIMQWDGTFQLDAWGNSEAEAWGLVVIKLIEVTEPSETKESPDVKTDPLPTIRIQRQANGPWLEVPLLTAGFATVQVQDADGPLWVLITHVHPMDIKRIWSRAGGKVSR